MEMGAFAGPVLLRSFMNNKQGKGEQWGEGGIVDIRMAVFWGAVLKANRGLPLVPDNVRANLGFALYGGLPWCGVQSGRQKICSYRGIAEKTPEMEPLARNYSEKTSNSQRPKNTEAKEKDLFRFGVEIPFNGFYSARNQ